MSVYSDTLRDLPSTRLVELLMQAHDTNRRLQRRCQEAEHEAAYYRKRYEAVQRPLAEAHKRAASYARAIRRLYNDEFMYRWRYCVGCRLTWWFKQWMRRYL